MLVEDDNNLREIYGARLLAEGYEIVSAKDGEEALALAVKEKPDLIISDIMMPKISGFDMLDILRSTPETKDTKVIMMTALSQAEDKERAGKLGADRYLVKSQVTLEDVAKAAAEVLAEVKGDQPTAAAPATIAPTTEPVAVVPAPTPAPEPVAAAEPAAETASPAPEATPAPEPTETPEPAAPEPVETTEPAEPAASSVAADPPVITPTVPTPAEPAAATPAPAAVSTPITVTTPAEPAAAPEPVTAAPEPATATPVAAAPTPVPTPTEPAATAAPAAAPTPAPAATTPAADNMQVLADTLAAVSSPAVTSTDNTPKTSVHTKVISPINDMTDSKPDLDKLLAQEEAKESGTAVSEPALTLSSDAAETATPADPASPAPATADATTDPKLGINISPDGTIQS